MTTSNTAIEISNLVRGYDKTDAVSGLSLSVSPGRCYGFFGRNGAGKTTTIKCLLNLLRPTGGVVRLFGLDPKREDVQIKSRLSYVPDHVPVYPWMSIQQYFEFLSSFRKHWNTKLEAQLLDQFGLESSRKVDQLSKGERVQVALIGALCPEPELLILDEPTSGLDPVIRREFIRTIIGTYQEADPENRTVFVSTHLISEFEGLIDKFTIIDKGREILTSETEAARSRFRRLKVRFPTKPPTISDDSILRSHTEGRELELIVDGNIEEIRSRVEQHQPSEIVEESLTLEDIFLVNAATKGQAHVIKN
jgi:ABC-2 type transport system ATP-binding protein